MWTHVRAWNSLYPSNLWYVRKFQMFPLLNWCKPKGSGYPSEKIQVYL